MKLSLTPRQEMQVFCKKSLTAVMSKTSALKDPPSSSPPYKDRKNIPQYSLTASGCPPFSASPNPLCVNYSSQAQEMVYQAGLKSSGKGTEFFSYTVLQ